MKLVIRTVFFHLLCIAVFAVVYYNLKDHFTRNNKEEFTILDYLSLSTTIQAGVGFSDMYPTTIHSKLALVVQQFLIIFAHIVTIYIFTL
jgi:hypothetical protein